MMAPTMSRSWDRIRNVNWEMLFECQRSSGTLTAQPAPRLWGTQLGPPEPDPWGLARPSLLLPIPLLWDCLSVGFNILPVISQWAGVTRSKSHSLFPVFKGGTQKRQPRWSLDEGRAETGHVTPLLALLGPTQESEASGQCLISTSVGLCHPVARAPSSCAPCPSTCWGQGGAEPLRVGLSLAPRGRTGSRSPTLHQLNSFEILLHPV